MKISWIWISDSGNGFAFKRWPVSDSQTSLSSSLSHLHYGSFRNLHQLRQLLNVMTLERISICMQMSSTTKSSTSSSPVPTSTTPSSVVVKQQEMLTCDKNPVKCKSRWGPCPDLFSCLKCSKIFGTPHGLEVLANYCWTWNIRFPNYKSWWVSGSRSKISRRSQTVRLRKVQQNFRPRCKFNSSWSHTFKRKSFRL